MTIKIPGHGTLIDDNGNTIGRITDLVIEGMTPTAAHDHLADAFPEELGNRRFTAIELAKGDAADLQQLRGILANSNAVYGKSGARLEGTLYDPAVVLKIRNDARRKLREYISTDMVKRAIAHGIPEEMRAVPIPRPTYLAVHVKLALDNWSNYK